MDHYAALLPKEPNPQDSYGEILRTADNSGRHLSTIAPHWLLTPASTLRRLAWQTRTPLWAIRSERGKEYDKAIANGAESGQSL